MGSTASNSTIALRILPFQAILRHDLRTLRESWLVRLWLAGSAMLTFLWAATCWREYETAKLIASLLAPYLIFPWFLVVMVLGVTPVSGSRVEALADGFLSRPVARHEYLLAVWLSRVVAVLAVYLVVMVPAVAIVALANRPAPADPVTLYGIVAAIAVVGLVLTLQVSLGFLLGTLLNKPLLAIVILLFLWFPVNGILHTFRLQSFSPFSLCQAMPTLLRQPWSEAASVGPDGGQKGADKAQDDAMLKIWGLGSVGIPGAGPPPRQERGQFFNHADEYADFSLLRVLLGYGLPTLAAVGLATLVFSLRDL